MLFVLSTRKSVLLFLVVCVALFTGCAISHSPNGSASVDRYAPGKGITFKEYAEGLPDTRIVVGFDIDDTILFSSPAFYYGKTNIDGSKNDEPNGCPKNRYLEFTSKENFSMEDIENAKQSFNEDLNNGLDEYNPPKAMALALIDLHAARGDSVYIITARKKTTTERVTEILKSVVTRNCKLEWGNQFVEPVIFTESPQAKHGHVKSKGISIYYGDADTDMTQAIAAGARPIRILRSPASYSASPARPGVYGEEVLLNSEY